MQQKTFLEEKQARHFMRWITNENLSPIEKPDQMRPPRQGGHPDYRFKDSTGHQYVLELTRLLTKELRKLESFVEKEICEPVESHLAGTCILHIPLDDSRGKGKITPEVAECTKEEISRLIIASKLQETQCLSTGFVLSKVRDDGHKLVPWVTAPTLPYDLSISDPIAEELQKEFEEVILGNDGKFRDYGGTKILLIDISQSGLDWEFHAQRFKDSQGILLTWVENMPQAPVNIDFIYLEPGVRVWQGNNMHRVLAGHKYVDKQAGHYICLWCRQGAFMKQA